MFFVLSKILHYTIQPIVIVCALLVLSIVIRNSKWKRRARVLGIALLLFFSNEFMANEVIAAWELPATPYADIHTYEAAILLTGVTVPNPNGPADRVYFALGADRLTHTVELYKLGIVKRVIVSGGSGKIVDDGSREALLLKNAMRMMGVPDSVIYTDASSDNTYQNAVESKKIMDKLGLKDEQCLLITSAFHMRRALACFKKAGVTIDYFTCDFRSHPRSFMPNILFVPSLEAIHIWQKMLKEWMGFVAYKLAGYI
jgi:uncharacterized SAM-binding protein YcdF (DUF218 family)